MRTTSWKYLVALALTLTLSALGCAKKEEPMVTDKMEAPAPDEAKAPDVSYAAGGDAHARLEVGDDLTDGGSIMFSADGNGVSIVAHIVGVAPGTHGLHVHEIGDCSSADFKSAGGHFNPTGAVHGAPTDAEHHAGDLGNIEIGEDGSGHLELVSEMLSLDDGDNSVVGRAVILHAKADDLVSQPTGAAGARLACGVVVREGS